MLKIYGSQQLAEQAARDNPQILNPSYSFCNTMLASADVLNNMMTKEEVSPCHVDPAPSCTALLTLTLSLTRTRTPAERGGALLSLRAAPRGPATLSGPHLCILCIPGTLCTLCTSAPSAGARGDDEQPCGAAVRPVPRHPRHASTLTAPSWQLPCSAAAPRAARPWCRHRLAAAWPPPGPNGACSLLLPCCGSSRPGRGLRL